MLLGKYQYDGIIISNQRRNDDKLSAGVVVEFEYDPVKSAKNLAKHGIDFEQAQRMWSGGKTVTLASKHAGNDDVRYLVLGMIAGKHCTAITTKRGNRIRLISVRRSRKDEERYYDQCE